MQSKEYTGAIIIIVATAFQLLKVDFSQEQLQNLTDTVLQLATTVTALISAIVVAVSRYKKGDINILGAKKNV